MRVEWIRGAMGSGLRQLDAVPVCKILEKWEGVSRSKPESTSFFQTTIISYGSHCIARRPPGRGTRLVRKP